MQMQKIEALNNEGHLTGAALAASNTLNGWIMEFESDNGDIIVATHADGQPAHWRKLEKATDWVRKMGFDSVRVID